MSQPGYAESAPSYRGRVPGPETSQLTRSRVPGRTVELRRRPGPTGKWGRLTAELTGPRGDDGDEGRRRQRCCYAAVHTVQPVPTEELPSGKFRKFTVEEGATILLVISIRNVTYQ